ncbi:MAG: ROK family transcriptional regulator [Actinobacteria bacterium]|nr:ROK family transcriptional regulator [Actinomycetota bacterium]
MDSFFRGSKKISTREINKKNILRIIKNSPSISRIDIAARLKISRPTVTAYIDELISEGLVNEIGFGKSTQLGGKKPRLLQFNDRANYIIGAKIGVRTTRAAITDLDANILEHLKVPTEEWLGPDAVISKLKKIVSGVIKKSGISTNKIIGIGIATTGLTDSQNGIVVFSPNLSGWSNIPLVQVMEKEFGITTFIDNECRVQAIAEKYKGLAINVNNFVCLHTGVGVGSGIFIDGKILSGSYYRGGEIGHVSVVEDGIECHCGNFGCLETVASTKKLIGDVISRVKSDENSILYRKIKDGILIEIEDIYEAFNLNEAKVADEVLKNAAWIGVGVANAIKVVDPELVIIHGKVVPFGEKYLRTVEETVRKLTFPKVKQDFEIKFTQLGEMVSVIGASVMVFDRVFEFNRVDIGKEFVVKKDFL